MPDKRNRRHIRRFPDEQTWIREFVGFHGTEGVTRFSESDLGGVSLTLVIEALTGGTVVSAEKCDGRGTVCVVEYYTEEDDLVVVTIHFVSNEGELTILSAEMREGLNSEPDRAA
jgi:hypothetical protein